MKIVLIGAASAQFGLGTLGDIFQSKRLHGAHIVLVDIKEQALKAVLAQAQEFLAAHDLPFTVSATTDRREALRGADFVVISIEVGSRFTLWDEDWTIPQQYGIQQIYGENGGAGGIFHALRITPVILDICADVEVLCPDAWVFNYSNPMTAITTAVLRAYPQMKFVGLCHEVLSLERYLPEILDTPFENLELRAAGLNHFSVLLEARYRDTQHDAYPDILGKAPLFFEREPGYSESRLRDTDRKSAADRRKEGRLIWMSSGVRKLADRTLFRRFCRPTSPSGDRGQPFGEYIPWAHEIATQGDQGFLHAYQLQLARIRPEIELRRDERLVLIIEGILDDSGYEEPAVNVMNDSLIPDLPGSIAVEVPARVYKNGLQPMSFPSYPKGFGALLRTYSGVYDLTVEAVLTGKKEYVVQALLANPMVSATASYEIGRSDDRLQREYLGYLVCCSIVRVGVIL